KVKSVKKELESLIESLKMLENYETELKITKELSVLQRKILMNSILEDGTIDETDIKNIVEFTILQNILELEKDKEVKEAIKYIDEFENIVDFTNEKMKIKQELVKEYIISKCQKEIEGLRYEKGYKEFKRQADKKKALWPIRQYMEKYNQEILSVFSCFLLGPETVSNVLPLIDGLFDVVIFDEASQMFIEDAIPTIYRAKKVIVAGDDKQLRPSGTFKSTVSSELDEDEEEIEDLAALEEESLLDLAKINYDKVHLTYHYRSQYEELISFSNYAFYDGRLKIAPNKISDNNDFKPIERIKCDGRWVDRSNVEEAKEVVNLVYKTLLKRENNETMGIITFNINQKSVIEDMLELKAQKDPIFRELYVKELERIENSEDVSLFVKNIENVQGDERDIIIFSIGYGKNEKGRISVNFGSLSQDGGENRLNVAISRAKKKIYLVTSIEPEEFNVESSKNKGPRLFKKYLQYVRSVSEGNKEEAKIILNSLIDSDVVKNEERKHDSDFEAEVYDALVEKGYEVHTQIGVSGYKIDMAIYDREKDEYVLGIECDGAAFHSSKSARERDIHRQRYLESRGWNIIRIWSRHWWKHPNKEINKIEMKLQELKRI
ncbi:MAG: AAA domain-containing protein, partial [Sarcina sp.]